MKALVCALALLAMDLGRAPTQAAWIARDGDRIVLRGEIEEGDPARLELALARPGAKVLVLDSQGGHLDAGIALGRIARAHRLATYVDAATSFCDSACTLVFIGGAHRHYVHAESLIEGETGAYGLGFHTSFSGGTRAQPSMKSQEGTQRMFEAYRALGVPSAIALARRGTIQALYRINGATALRTKVATSLKAP